MSKTPSNKLFKLIKSLSASEKRYFQLYANNGIEKSHKYIQLFDAIEVQTEFNDDDLKKVIYQNEPIESRKYSELKAYLYDLILKSLQKYDEKSSLDFRLKNLLLNIRVLFKRGHYEECKDIIYKANKLANKYEDFSVLLELLAWEKKIAYTQSNIVFLDREFDRIDRHEKNYLSQLRNISDYQHIFFKIMLSIRKENLLRNQEQKLALKKLLDDELMISIDKAQSFKASVLYLRIYGLYYYSILEYQKFYTTSKQLLELIESKPVLLKENVTEHISALSNSILSCGVLDRYEEVSIGLKKLREIKTKTLEDERIIHFQYYSMSFSLCIAIGNFEQGLFLLQEQQKELKKFEARLFESGSFYFSYFYIHFGVGNYDKALEYLNEWLSLPRSAERQDLQSLARILNLIVHYEMNNTLLLEYLLRSSYRYLRNRNRAYEIERKVLGFIKDSIKIQGKKELKTAFIQLKESIDEVADHPSENAMLRYFNFTAWIDSKIEEKSFGEIIKRNKQMPK